LDKFLLQKKGKRWDGVPVPKVSTDDLKQETFDFFRRRAFKNQRIEEDILTDTTEHLLENLQLVENDFLKRAAILLFHHKPENFITGAYIKIGFFKSDHDLKFQDEVHGNIFEQIEKSIDLLFTKYIKSAISYEGIHRIEKYEYPKDAVREALLNAITHKDYSGGVPIQISVYTDKIIFWNEGQLPENWTVKNLMEKHASRPFNPDIANALFRSGYIEAWGRGTIKIINECKEANIPEPIFTYNSSDITIEFRKDIYNAEYLHNLKLNERQLDALIYFRSRREIVTSDYVKKYTINERTARRDLIELVEKGILIRQGDKKSTKYKYL
jgi:ATP-dependent DNA helicase RecG